MLDAAVHDWQTAAACGASPQVCAYSVPDLLDPVVQRSMAGDLARIAVKCQQIGPDAGVVVLDVPPQPRFEP